MFNLFNPTYAAEKEKIEEQKERQRKEKQDRQLKEKRNKQRKQKQERQRIQLGENLRYQLDTQFNEVLGEINYLADFYQDSRALNPIHQIQLDLGQLYSQYEQDKQNNLIRQSTYDEYVMKLNEFHNSIGDVRKMAESLPTQEQERQHQDRQRMQKQDKQSKQLGENLRYQLDTKFNEILGEINYLSDSYDDNRVLNPIHQIQLKLGQVYNQYEQDKQNNSIHQSKYDEYVVKLEEFHNSVEDVRKMAESLEPFPMFQPEQTLSETTTTSIEVPETESTIQIPQQPKQKPQQQPIEMITPTNIGIGILQLRRLKYDSTTQTIINPFTSRRVNINRPRGQKILETITNILNKSPNMTQEYNKEWSQYPREMNSSRCSTTRRINEKYQCQSPDYEPRLNKHEKVCCYKKQRTKKNK